MWQGFVDAAVRVGNAGVEAYESYTNARLNRAVERDLSKPQGAAAIPWNTVALVGGGILLLVLVVGMFSHRR